MNEKGGELERGGMVDERRNGLVSWRDGYEEY